MKQCCRKQTVMMEIIVQVVTPATDGLCLTGGSLMEVQGGATSWMLTWVTVRAMDENSASDGVEQS